MANEVRLIDANALEKRMEERLNSLRKAFGNYDHYTDGFEEGCVAVEDAETIDPESLRPKGRWEKYWCETDLIGHMYEVCPNCQSCEILDTDKFWDSNYCPNCGAKMEG